MSSVGGLGGFAGALGGGAGGARAGGAGSGGTAGGAADPCLTDPGDQYDMQATQYTLGMELRACLSADVIPRGGQKSLDVDDYGFTTPDDGGGYVVVRVSDIVMRHQFDNPYAYELKLSFTAGNDEGPVATFSNEGEPIDTSDIAFWFGVEANTTYHVSVAFDDPPEIDLTEYTFRAEYTAAPDPFEPNNRYNQPPFPRIELGKSIQAYLLGGWEGASVAPFDDYYVVTLADRPATVSITDVPSDLRIVSVVMNLDAGTNGPTPYGGGTTANPGDDLTYDVEPPPGGGDVILGVYLADSTTKPYGRGATPAHYATQPYTLEITQ